jgi:hypothetical protein
VETIRGGGPVASTRGPREVASFLTVGESLAGVDDRLADSDVGLDDLTLVGLRAARERGHSAPPVGEG